MAKESFNPTEPWKILAEHDEVNNQWLRVRNVTFQLPNGHTLEDYYLAERPSVVVIIPFQEGKTYLFQEYERGVNEVGHKFPGGRIDEGETPDTAAMREFQEELGLMPSELISLGTTYVDPGFMPTLAHYFLCANFEESPSARVDSPTELFEGSWVDFSDVASGISKNTIKNPFVIVGYALALGYLAKQEPGKDA